MSKLTQYYKLPSVDPPYDTDFGSLVTDDDDNVCGFIHRVFIDGSVEIMTFHPVPLPDNATNIASKLTEDQWNAGLRHAMRHATADLMLEWLGQGEFESN